MTLDNIIQVVVEFVRNHEHWAIPIVFFLAFGESLAFLSLLLPATVILLGLGALVGESGIAFWPLWLAASVGAFMGDWSHTGLAIATSIRLSICGRFLVIRI